VLSPVYFLAQGLQGICLVDPYGGLINDLPTIDFLVDLVDRATGHLHPVPKRFTDPVQSGKTGQETGMQVDDPAREGFEETGLEHAHESSQDHEIGSTGFDRIHIAALTITVQFGPKWRRIEEGGWNPEHRAQFEDGRIQVVGKEMDHLGPAELTVSLSLQYGLRV